MDVTTPMYSFPEKGQKELGVRPQLASWDAAGSSSQVRLEEFLSEAVKVCDPQFGRLAGLAALRLDVGLPETTPLLDQHDLDNYLFPLVTRLSRSGRTFVSVWGTKRHSSASHLAVVAAVPASPDTAWPHVFDVRTTASAGTAAFKEQIDEQLARALPLPDGPLRLHIGFVVGPRRQWPNLWKPTIDALGKVLGRTAPDRPWHPRDGRIVQLGLSTRTDPSLGNNVVLRIHAGPASGSTAP
ncbi:hypothetical protein ACH35V_01335 [Actinomadura sp. 1N219]|uniref:hypothetical protein n=1 Tax=Actinomadura sp. 1N219 TaxID=3375152 RepID=UPI0037A2258E